MKLEEKQDVAILVPELRQIDVNNSPRFSSDLEAFLADRNKVVLDLANVNFMDSTGLGIIVSALRTINEKKGRMVLCQAMPAVKVLFDMVRLSQIASIYTTRDEAVEALSR